MDISLQTMCKLSHTGKTDFQNQLFKDALWLIKKKKVLVTQLCLTLQLWGP